MPSIPWGDLDTLFLDAGNTLVSMDFTWISRELAALGIDTTPRIVERAEAAARPVVDAALDRLASTEGADTFHYYLTSLVERVPGVASPAPLVVELAPVLRSQGSQRLWSNVLPGVEDALGRLRSLGFKLVVVSNSDGTVERGLAERGLRPFFDAVVDSHVVGVEKPDRRIFEHALEVAGSLPDRTLHVGDMYSADVIGARGAGIHALLLDPYDDWTDVDCERLQDLRALARRFSEARGSRGSG